MVADPTIGLFMEDNAHERFIKSLIERIASEASIHVQCDVRNATGGIPKMRGELRRFLRSYTDITSPIFDVLIIVQDADYYGESHIRKEIQDQIIHTGYPGDTIVAVPEPYIEAWYLADPVSLQSLLGLDGLPSNLQDDWDKDKYKIELEDIFRNSPLGGGIEYADEIVASMNLYRAGQNVSSLRHFIDDLRSMLTQLASNA